MAVFQSKYTGAQLDAAIGRTFDILQWELVLNEPSGVSTFDASRINGYRCLLFIADPIESSLITDWVYMGSRWADAVDLVCLSRVLYADEYVTLETSSNDCQLKYYPISGDDPSILYVYKIYALKL